MGVDLTLLPTLSRQLWASHTMLPLERRRALWDAMAELPKFRVPVPLDCYLSYNPNFGDHGYGPVTEDPYGQPLEYTTPETLLTLKEHEGVTDNPTNRAIWAYLEQMPVGWPIVLYWH